MTRRRRAAACLLVALLALARDGRGAATEAPSGEELDALQRAIELRRGRLRAYESRELGLLEVLEEIDRASADLGAELRRTERALREAQEGAARAEAEAREAEARREATRRTMSRRAAALYKMGEIGPVRALFSARSLRDLVARAQRLRVLLAQDAALLGRLRADDAALASARAAVKGAQAARERAQARLAGGREALAAERSVRRELLAQLRADRDRERAGLAELEAAARALESTLDDLRVAPAGPVPPAPGATPFASLRGRLDPPVDAPVARPFGRVVDAEFRTETFRKGVEFGAQFGEVVRAVADGEVRYAGWFRGYGKLVIVDHGEQWFTVAGHLEELRVDVGDAVRAGDPIGTVGDTGSLGGASLYFEIRQGRDAVDPAEWLVRSPRLD